MAIGWNIAAEFEIRLNFELEDNSEESQLCHGRNTAKTAFVVQIEFNA